MAELVVKAFLKCETDEIAIAGYRVTGIFPFKRNVDFAPSEDASVQEINLQDLKASKGRTVKKKSPTLPQIQSSHHDPHKPSTPNTADWDHRFCRPSATDLTEAGSSRCPSSLNFGLISPQDILPKPKPNSINLI